MIRVDISAFIRLMTNKKLLFRDKLSFLRLIWELIKTSTCCDHVTSTGCYKFFTAKALVTKLGHNDHEENPVNLKLT